MATTNTNVALLMLAAKVGLQTNSVGNNPRIVRRSPAADARTVAQLKLACYSAMSYMAGRLSTHKLVTTHANLGWWV